MAKPASHRERIKVRETELAPTDTPARYREKIARITLDCTTVEATSAGVGKGSEFTVRIPAVVEPAARVPRHSPVSGGLRRTSAGKRILVVDDNKDSADSLASLLSVMGHDVVTAHDGLEALERVRNFTPEVALLDLGMPRLNGYEAARRMRQTPGLNGTMLIAMTGWGQEEDRQKSREAGFDEHMVKPVEILKLEKLLEGL